MSSKAPAKRPSVVEALARKACDIGEILGAEDFNEMSPETFGTLVTTLSARPELLKEFVVTILQLGVTEPAAALEPLAEEAVAIEAAEIVLKVQMRVEECQLSTVKTFRVDKTVTVAQLIQRVASAYNVEVQEDIGLFYPHENPPNGRWLPPLVPLAVLGLTQERVLQFRHKIRPMRIRNNEGNIKSIMVDESLPLGELLVDACDKFMMPTAGAFLMPTDGKGAKDRLRLGITLTEQGLTAEDMLVLSVDATIDTTTELKVRLCGFLDKSGPKSDRWNKRWFELTTQALTYYKDKTDKAKKEPAGIIPLDEIRVAAEADEGRKNLFAVHTPERVYLIQASDGPERAIWLDAINNMIHPRVKDHARVALKAVKQGWLKECVGQKLIKRWCMLSAVQFRTYKARETAIPLTSIGADEIDKCKQSATSPVPNLDPACFFQIVINGTPTLYMAESELQCSRWVAAINHTVAAEKTILSHRKAAFSVLNMKPGCDLICATIFESPVLKPLITQMLDMLAVAPKLEPFNARYFALMVHLLLKCRPQHMMEIISNHGTIVKRLIMHVASPPISDVLFAILQHTPGPDWLVTHGVFDLLMAQLVPVHGMIIVMTPSGPEWQIPGEIQASAAAAAADTPAAASATPSSAGAGASALATPKRGGFDDISDCPLVWRQCLVTRSTMFTEAVGETPKTAPVNTGDFVFVSDGPAPQGSVAAQIRGIDGYLSAASVRPVNEQDSLAAANALLYVMDLASSLDARAELKKVIFSAGTTQTLIKHATGPCEAVAMAALTLLCRLLERYVDEARAASAKFQDTDFAGAFQWVQCKVQCEFVAENDHELSVHVGEIIFADPQSRNDGWMMALSPPNSGIVPLQFATPHEASEEMIAHMPPVLRCVLESMSALMGLFISPPRVAWPNAFRLEVLRVIHRLLASNHPVLDARFLQLNVLGYVAGLLFTKPNANILHKSVVDILATILGGSNAYLVRCIVTDVKLHERILESFAPNRPRGGNMGYLVRLAHLLSEHTLTNALLADNQAWQEFIKGEFLVTMNRNNQIICPEGLTNPVRVTRSVGELDAS